VDASPATVGRGELHDPQLQHRAHPRPLHHGGGHYQAGTWLVDFTDPAQAFTLAYSDPAPIAPTQLGGAWSSYWYNRSIYESSITEGINVFRYQERGVRRRSLLLDHLNPQTQEFSLPPGEALREDAAAGGEEPESDT